jgi:ABC-type sugar transport system ATPase subunit
MSELLRMEGIRKRFVGVEVLHGVDLDLRPAVDGIAFLRSLLG